MEKRIAVIFSRLLLLIALVGCDTTDKPTETSVGGTTTPINKSLPEAISAAPATSLYHEAPQLAEKVAQAKLSPVGERLPANPMIVQPEEEIGIYGGTLEVPVASLGSRLRLISYEPLVRWDAQWSRVIPNVAQSVDVSDDATTYTFHLREGMRWSDGELFSADDIVFWYKAVFLNKELTPRPQGWLSSDGVPVTVEKVDALTVVFRFAEPNSFFLFELARVFGVEPTRYPRHYLEQFHIDYNPDIDTLIEGSGAADWVELFRNKATTELFGGMAPCENPELPVLNAWVQAKCDTTIVAERNPYYWKVDTDFNQLPYIDRVVFVQVETLAEYKTALNDGAAHLVFDDEFNNFSVLDVDMEKLKATTLVSSFSSHSVIGLNLNHSDPVLREIFQNKDFRVGLSHAINRPQIIDQVFGGAGEPYQVGPRPESPFYNEQLARQYTEYDVDLANTYLDRAGCAERDAEGFRLRPDGKRITFSLQTGLPDTVDVMELVSQHWRAVGIDVSVEFFSPESRQEYTEQLFANQYDTYVSQGVGGLDVILQPAYYLPLHPFASWYARAWAYWYQDPTNPLTVEPPAAVQRQMALYDQLRYTIDADEQSRLMTQILEIAANEFYVIGTVLDPNAYMLTSAHLKNVPRLMPLHALAYPTPAPTNPAQYFIGPGK